MNPGGKRVVCAIAVLCCSLAAEAMRIGNLDAKGYPVIVPTVKKLTPAPGAFTLPAALTVTTDAKINLEPLEKTYAAEVEGGTVRTVEGDRAACRFILRDDGVPDSNEGYRLSVTLRGVKIESRSARGLFWGLQSFCWMVRNRAGDALKCCTIEDWPDLKLRALFLEANDLRPEGMDSQCAVLEGLAALKYNSVLCDFADNLPLSIADEFVRPTTLSREDIERFKAVAKKNNLAIIPYLQVLSHALWLSRHRDWEEMSEGPASMPWCRGYCPQNEHAAKIVDTVITETCDMFKPKLFHLALDEMWGCPHGVCPKCQGKNLVDLVWNHVKPYHDKLFARGIRPIVYHDEFDRTNPTRPQQAYVDVLDRMDKRVLVNCWQYQLFPAPFTYLEFRERGHEGFYMSWHMRLLNSINLPRLAHRVGSKGCVLAYWLGMRCNFNDIGWAGVGASAATVYQGNYSWNAGDVDCTSLPFDAHRVFARIFKPEFVTTFEADGSSVPLDGAFNALLGGGHARYPALDVKTLARVRKDVEQGKDGFRLGTQGGRLKGVVLTGKEGAYDFPESVTIPVGAKTEGLSFLVFAAPGNSYVLAENIGRKPEIGSFVMKFADGRSERVPLVFQFSIHEWNSRIGSLKSRVVTRFNDAKGSLANLYAVDWKNPYPETEVREVKFNSSKAEADIEPVLLALSTHGDPVKAKPAAAGTLKDLVPVAEPVFKSLFDFSKGTLNGLRIDVTNCGPDGKETREIEKTADHGKVLKFVFPVLPKPRIRRVTVDFPIGADEDFTTFTADVFIDHPEFITRSDAYVMGRNGQDAAINYDRGFPPGWTLLRLPRSIMSGKERAGAPKGERWGIRLGFMFSNDAPLTIRVGNAGISMQPEPGRFDIRDRVE